MRFPDLPKAMQALPVDHRGFPVPWFVQWIDGEPVFPAMDGTKLVSAQRDGLCWVCGGKLPTARAYVIGPMCVINRISSEPASHLDCARFSARNCPFLANPRMKRVPHHKLGAAVDDLSSAGIMIERNPGACAVYITQRAAKPFRAGDGVLFELPKPSRVEWFAHGRSATRDEVLASINSGLPLLDEQCGRDVDPEASRLALAKMAERAIALVPA